MSTFPLRVGTPDGLLYEGDVARVVCRTISGDLAILPGHCNYCTALGMGEAHIVLEDGTRRNAACIGGMLSMMNGVCRVLATTWEMCIRDRYYNRARQASITQEITEIVGGAEGV